MAGDIYYKNKLTKLYPKKQPLFLFKILDIYYEENY